MQVVINKNNRPFVQFDSKCYLEGSWGSQSIGLKKCSLELWDNKKGDAMIEFVVGLDHEDGYEEVENIGIRYDAETKRCLDYDGVFSVPSQAIDMLNALGFDTTDIDV